MQSTGGKSWRCPAGRACKQRCRIEDGTLAFTPFAAGKAAGWDAEYLLFLKTAYCAGLKMGLDQTLHMVRPEEGTVFSSYQRVQRMLRRHKLAMAWCETERALRHQYEKDRAHCGVA